MDLDELLAIDFDAACKLLVDKGHIIEHIEYLNNPPGLPRIIRVRENSPNRVELLVSYQLDFAQRQSINPL